MSTPAAARPLRLWTVFNRPRALPGAAFVAVPVDLRESGELVRAGPPLCAASMPTILRWLAGARCIGTFRRQRSGAVSVWLG